MAFATQNLEQRVRELDFVELEQEHAEGRAGALSFALAQNLEVEFAQRVREGTARTLGDES